MAEQQVTNENPDYKVGDIVKFKAYGVTTEEDLDPILAEGEFVKITALAKDKDDGLLLNVSPVTEDGGEIKGRQGDQLFPEEVEALADTPVAEPVKATTKAPAKKKAAAKKTTAAKADAKPKAAGKAKAKAPVKAKTPMKAKAATTAAAKKAAPKKKAAAKAKAPTKAKTASAPKKKAATATKKKATTKKAEAPAPIKPRASTNVAELHDAHVLQVLSEEQDAVEAARKLIGRREEIYFTLGGILCKIQEDKFHVAGGFDDTAEGFSSYVETRIGGIERRRAYYLMKIYRKLRAAGISHADLESIGWTKARVLTNVEDGKLVKHKDELLAYARKNTRDELDKYTIKKGYVTVKSGERINRTKFSFALLGEEATLAERAIAYAKERVEGGDENQAFHLIVTEYLTMCEEVEGAATLLPKTEDDLVAYARDKLGMDITVNSQVGVPAEVDTTA